MKSICIIAPISTPVRHSKSDPEAIPGEPPVRIRRVYLPSAPPSIECEYDIARAAAPVAEAALDAQRSGDDAVVVDCFADPGVRAARELVSIPVCGAGETSMRVAAGLAGPFSVVTVLESIIPIIRDSARQIGAADRLASVRSIGVPVQRLPDADLGALIFAEAAGAVDDDGATAVVLGCTGLVGVSEEVQKRLRRRSGQHIPVIDASSVPVMYAWMLVQAGLRHSKRHYRFPPEKDPPGRSSN